MLIGFHRPESITRSTHPEDTGVQRWALPDTIKSDSNATPDPSVSFISEACLFCLQISVDLEANLIHMQKAHGLLIPTSIDNGALHLAVDLETIVGYMHLIIFEYHECLACGRQRVDGWAARQHMMGRGHCRIDLASAESEWRDFYESEKNTRSEREDDNEDEVRNSFYGRHWAHNRAEGQMPRVSEGSNLHLSCGKVVAHRTASTPKSPRHKSLGGHKSKGKQGGVDHLLRIDSIHVPQRPSVTSYNTDVADPSSLAGAAFQSPPSQAQGQALAHNDRSRLSPNRTFLAIAIAEMTTHDRAALARLSLPERRATVMGQFKLQGRVQMAGRRYWSRLERRQDRPAVGGKVYIGGG